MEAETLRQELSSLVVEIREFAEQIKLTPINLTKDVIAETLLNICGGDPR